MKAPGLVLLAAGGAATYWLWRRYRGGVVAPPAQTTLARPALVARRFSLPAGIRTVYPNALDVEDGAALRTAVSPEPAADVAVASAPRISLTESRISPVRL